MVLKEILILGVAGGLGTICRFLLSGLTHRMVGDHIPWGTLAVNVLGCFLLAFLLEMGLATASREIRIAVAVGFLGGFTTFSTFGFETMKLMREGAVALAALNMAANLILGFTAVWLGFVTAKKFV